jgi:hypothetical protein
MEATGESDEVLMAQLVVGRKAGEDEGDAQLEAMCAAGLALFDSGCRTMVTLPGGGRSRLPVAVAATAAKLAVSGCSEARWRYEFTKLILQDWPTGYPLTVARLIGSCVHEQRKAGLWPWK